MQWKKIVQLCTLSLCISIYSLQVRIIQVAIPELPTTDRTNLEYFLNLLVNEAIYVYIAGPKKEQKTTSKRLRVSKRVSPFSEATERRHTGANLFL